MAEIAEMLAELMAQNEALGVNITEKGVEATGSDGLITLAEKVKLINQHIASGTRETVRVSAAGAVSAGDFVTFVDELVAAGEILAETGSPVGSDFIGSRRVALAFVRDGSLYVKAVGQEEDGTLALGNSVLVASGTAPAKAEVIGQTDGAAVIYVDQGTTWAARVTYNSLTGTLAWVDAIDVDNGANVTGCAMEEGKLLVCMSHDEQDVTYPKTVSSDGVALLLSVLNLLGDAYFSIYGYGTSTDAAWDTEGTDEQEIAEILANDYPEALAELTDTDRELKYVQYALQVIDSIDVTTGEYTIPEDMQEDMDGYDAMHAIFSNVLPVYIEQEYKEVNKVVTDVRPSVMLVVELGDTGATVTPSRLEFLPETDEYLQSWSVAALTTTEAVLVWFEDYDKPMKQAMITLNQGTLFDNARTASCVTAASMPCVSVTALAADCAGIAGAVRKTDSTDETLLVFEGWYIVREFSAMQPYYWGAEDRSVGTNISHVYTDAMGTDYALVSCVLDGTVKSAVIALHNNRPESGPTVALEDTDGYARLHGLNGSYALGVVERDGKIYVGAWQRVRCAMKADNTDLDALAAEAGEAGGTVPVYSA